MIWRPTNVQWIFATIVANLAVNAYAILNLVLPSIRLLIADWLRDVADALKMVLTALLLICLLLSICGNLLRRRKYLWVFLCIFTLCSTIVFLETAFYVLDLYFPQGLVLEGAQLSLSNFAYLGWWIALAILNTYVFFGPIGARFFSRPNRESPDETSPPNTAE
jgi:hypothetical protein